MAGRRSKPATKKQGRAANQAPGLDLGRVYKAIKKSAGCAAIAGMQMTDVAWVSTGLPLLDLALGGGLPLGRIVHIWGGSGEGKTCLGLWLTAQIQRQDPSAVVLYLDSERALSCAFVRLLGVDVSRLVVVEPATAEEAFQAMETGIAEMRKAVGNDKLLFVVWDSVAASPSKAIQGGDYDNQQPGRHAAAMSIGLKKLRPVVYNHRATLLMLNQQRMSVGVTFGTPKHPTGGQAVIFFSDVSICLALRERYKITTDADPYGIRVEAKVEKNRVGVPYRRASFRIYFHSGLVTDTPEVYPTLRRYGLAGSAGGTIRALGGTYPSKDAFAQALLADPALLTKALDQLRKAMEAPDAPALAAGGGEVADG